MKEKTPVNAQNYSRLVNNLEQLKLKSMMAALPDYLTLVEQNEKDFIQALYELTELEKEAKQERIIKACVRTAGFPFMKELSDFDFSFQPGLNKGKIMELSTLRFIENHENILFLGTPGTGKTHLATAIGIEAARNHYSTYFVSCQSLIEQLKRAEHENRLEAKLKQYARYRLLIIDEIGYLNLDSRAANLMFQLISRRYEKRSTIITTNVDFGEWEKLLGDPTIANAILDCLLHHSHFLKIMGPSYRTKDILKPRKGRLQREGADA